MNVQHLLKRALNLEFLSIEEGVFLYEQATTSELMFVANEIKRILQDEDLLNEGASIGRQFFVSDYTDSFEKSTQIFFGETIKLTQYPIWD